MICTRSKSRLGRENEGRESEAGGVKSPELAGDTRIKIV